MLLACLILHNPKDINISGKKQTGKLIVFKDNNCGWKYDLEVKTISSGYKNSVASQQLPVVLILFINYYLCLSK